MGQNLMKESYLRAWSNVLHASLGWDARRISEWASKWTDQMTDPQSLFYHDPPMRYVALLLVPDDLRERRAGQDLVILRRQIQDALEFGNEARDYENPEELRDALRRVQELFAELRT
jgi:hypothetical protein